MIQKLLDSREFRAARQKEFIAKTCRPLICVNVNIPGIKKRSKDALFIYETIKQKLLLSFKNNIKELLYLDEETGIEGYFSSFFDAKTTKKLCIKLESHEVLGRFIDLDVIDIDGKILSRKDFNLPSRKCFICDEKAILCARARSHDINELLEFIHFSVESYKKFQHIALIAKNSLKVEIELTPKPGLVDRDDNGSHKDMDIYTFYKSIDAISEFFVPFLSVGFLYKNDIFYHLRELGKKCEIVMNNATNGVNTHKGAIFIYAVILGSIGSLLRQKQQLNAINLQTKVQDICKNLVKNDLLNQNPKSAGERFYNLTQNGGIRAEAQNGFKNVLDYSLVFFREKKSQFCHEKALKLTLLALINCIDDTAIFNRGGLEGLEFAKKEAFYLLQDYSEFNLKKLNRKFIEKNLSPGGSADLLALTWFLDKILS